MKIYLDTNVFYNDWFMNHANFRYFFYYIANEYEELIISKVVCEEVENIRRREAEQSASIIKDEFRNLKKLLSFDVSYDFKSIENFTYDFIELLKNKCENISVIEYDEIPHAEIVSRALINKKPFFDGEKGYRDTLIWLSLLFYLKKEDYSGEVALITRNKSDFFVNKKGEGLVLHQDLESDLLKYGIKAKIIPYDSLFSFINDNVDKKEHVVVHSKMYNLLEHEGISYFSNISGSDLARDLSKSRFSHIPLRNIIRSEASIFEGLEDESLFQSKEIDKNTVYVGYTFNLRRVILNIEIPKEDYLLYKSDLDKDFYEAVDSDTSVILETIIRPYFEISFLYNVVTENYSGVDIRIRRIQA